MVVATKVCSKCGEAKALAEFHRQTQSVDGLQTRCKECARRLTIEYSTANKARASIPPVKRKRCPKCKAEKPASDFAKKAANKDGLQSRCKQCMSEFLSGYYQDNRDRMNAYSKAWYEANKEHHAVLGAAWRKANKEAESATKRAHYAANRDRLKAASAARYADKGAAIREKQIARNKANPENRRAIDNRMRAKREAAPGSFTGDDVKALMRLQGGKCIACRCDIRKTFHVDHIEALAKGGSNDKANLQLLCPTCNKQKHARDSVEFMRTKGFLL